MKWRHCLAIVAIYSITSYAFVLIFITSVVQNPVLEIQEAVLGKCCASEHGSEDICGGPKCLWSCNRNLSTDSKFVGSLGDEAFFHETSGSETLNYRQACSVESLARLNPEMTVNVLMTSNGLINFTSNQMQALANYSNIKIKPIKLSQYFMHTPLERWYFCTDWNFGPYAVSHLSDALRFLTLYKFGGYYFDLDVVMLQPVAELRNFTAAESNETVAAGALHVDYRHPFILDVVNEFQTTYRKNEWNFNGPGVLTRALLKQCNAKSVLEIRTDSPNSCKHFNVYPPDSFYPIHYDNWTQYFSSEALDVQWERTSIGAHVWNKLSKTTLVFKNSSQLYNRLSQSFCPMVYSAAPDAF